MRRELRFNDAAQPGTTHKQSSIAAMSQVVL
jgi:hypothetical protein